MSRILIAVDGSAPSDNAVRFVIGLARRGPLEIHVVTVQPTLPGGVRTFVPKELIDNFYNEEGRKALASACALLDAAGLGYETHIAIGPIARAVVEYAERTGCEQIVMGSRGHGAATGLLLGSVATGVIAKSTQPVTIVK